MPSQRDYEIEIADSQDVVSIDEQFVQNVARTALAAEDVTSAAVSLAIVDNMTIHELNRQYLDHDYETDVLSFLLECEPSGVNADSAASLTRGAGKRIDGEIIVSAEMALQRAEEFAWQPQDELALYVIHGLLHLAGYDDTTEPERLLMRQREQSILAELGIESRGELSARRTDN